MCTYHIDHISSNIIIYPHPYPFSCILDLGPATLLPPFAILSCSQKVSIFWSSPWNIKTTGAEARGVSPSHCKSSRRPKTVPHANSNGKSRWRILTFPFPSVSNPPFPSHRSSRGARWQGKKREVNLSWFFSTWQEGDDTFLMDSFCSCTSWFIGFFAIPRKTDEIKLVGIYSLSPGKHGPMKNGQYQINNSGVSFFHQSNVPLQDGCKRPA